MRKRILLILALAVSFTSLKAQNVIDLIIAEALAVPDSTGIVDDFGRQGGWIEIFNTSQGTVNIAGCFLTDDRSNLKKSIIPKGDLRTKIGPRQTTLSMPAGTATTARSTPISRSVRAAPSILSPMTAVPSSTP